MLDFRKKLLSQSYIP